MRSRFSWTRATLFAAFLLSLVPAAHATIVASPNSVSAKPGQSTTTVTLNLTFSSSTFAGRGTISFPNLPFGVTTSPSPVEYSFGVGATTATTSFLFNIAANANQGTFSIDVVDATLNAGTTTMTLQVIEPTFTATASPNPVTLTSGGPSSPVTVQTTTEPGFNQTVDYSFVGFPAEINFGPTQSVSAAQGYRPVTFNVIASPNAQPGTYNGFLNGQIGRAFVKQFPFTVVVQRPDIDSSFTQRSLSLCNSGPAAGNSLALAPVNGYNGTPQLSFTGLPQGFVVSPATLTAAPMPPPQTIPFTIRANGAAPGTHTITVNVSDARFAINKNVTFLVTVENPAFTELVSPGSMNLVAGGGGQTVTASIAPNACFTAQSVTVAPASIPQGFTVTPGAQTISGPSYPPTSFVIRAGAGVAPGDYTILFNFTPSSGAAPRTARVQVRVDAAPDFVLSVTPATLTIPPGQSSSVTVGVTGINGFTGNVTVTAPSLPGITFSPASFSVPAGASQTVNVSVAAGTRPQTVNAIFTGSAAGIAGTRDAGVVITVPEGEAPNFTLQITPSSLTIPPGQSSSVTVGVTGINGFTGNVTVTAPSLPGITFSPASFSVSAGASQTVSVSVAAGPPAQSVNAIFTGSAPGIAGTREAGVVITVPEVEVPNFSLLLTPSSLTIPAGQSATTTVSVIPANGFTGTVTVTTFPIPGVTFSPSTFTIPPGGQQVVNVSVHSATAATSFTTLFSATSPSVTGTRVAELRLTITEPALPPDFRLTVSPPALTLPPGGSGTVTVSAVGLNGFTGPIVISASSVPGLVLTPSQFTIVPGTSQAVNVAVLPGASPASAPVTFTGTAAGVAGSRTAAVTVTVGARPDFSLSVAPQALDVIAGETGTVVVTATGVNGFTGPILVTAAGPGIAGFTLTPSTFTLLPGGSQTVTITAGATTSIPQPLRIEFVGSAAGIEGMRSAPLLLTITPRPPIITLVDPASVATGTVGRTVIVTGNFFAPGAVVRSTNPGVIIERVVILSPTQAELTVNVREDAAPGATTIILTNPNGGVSTPAGTLLVYPAGSLSAPLGVTAAAIVFPAHGTLISGDETIYPRGLLATTGLGTIIGTWQFDGVPFDRFMVTVHGGFPAEVRSNVPIPISFHGGHTLELVIESPQRAVATIEIIHAAESLTELTIFAPQNGMVVPAADPPLFRWSMVPRTSGYLVELLAEDPEKSQRVDLQSPLPLAEEGARMTGEGLDALLPIRRIRVSDPEWQPSAEDITALGAGLRTWRVRAVFPGETEGTPTEWHRIAVLPDRVVLTPPDATQFPLIRWGGGIDGLLYRLEFIDAGGRVVFSALTSRQEYRVPAQVRTLSAGMTLRVTAFGPGGVILGTATSQPGTALKAPARNGIVLVQAAVSVTRRSPEGEIKTPQPTIAAEWKGEVRAEDVSLVIDETDVTAVATIGATSITYDSLLPLAAGQHTVRLALGDELNTWTFTIPEEDAAPVPTPQPGDPALPPALPQPGMPTPPPAPATPEKKRDIRKNWAVSPLGTLTVIHGSGRDDVRAQLSARTDVATETRMAKVTGDVSLKRELNDPGRFLQESRNWVARLGVGNEIRTEGTFGFTTPDFLDQSELLTTGLARAGAQGRLILPFGVASYYESIGTRPLGIVAGNFGPEQKVRAGSFRLPTNPKWDLRLIGLQVEDEPGFNSSGGSGDAFGLFARYIVSPRLSLLFEGARGSFDPNIGSAERDREGTAFRIGLTGSQGTLNYALTLRQTEAEFVNPANRGFTPGGVPDRRGGMLVVSKGFGNRTSISAQIRHLREGTSSGQLIRGAEESGGNLNITTRLTSRVSLTLGGTMTTNEADGNAELFIPQTDRTQSGLTGTLTESVGRFTLTQTLSRQQVRDQVNATAEQTVSMGTLTVGGTITSALSISGALSGTRSEGSPLYGTTEQTLLSIQPSYAIHGLYLSLQPRIMFSQTENDVNASTSENEQYQALITWSPPWRKSLLSLQISTDWSRSEFSGQSTGFVRRYAGTLSMRNMLGTN